jgi:hypothetical protein
MISGEAEDFEKAELRPEDLCTGGKPAAYEWHLANPRSDCRSRSNLQGTRSRLVSPALSDLPKYSSSVAKSIVGERRWVGMSTRNRVSLNWR